MANVMDIITEKIRKGELKVFIPSHYTLKLFKVTEPTSYDNEYGEGHYDLVPGDPILEGTKGEHWSPKWIKIVKKYLLESGLPIDSNSFPSGKWVIIQTNPDKTERRKNVTWAIDANKISTKPFKVDGLTIDPMQDVLCIGGTEDAPNAAWGIWPVKKEIFADTYEPLK